MIISYKFNLDCILYNRVFSPNNAQARSFEIVFAQEVDLQNLTKASVLEDYAAEARELLHKAHILRADDPYLVNLLEPKAGGTRHTLIEAYKAELTDYLYVSVPSNTVPPETINGYKVIVLGSGYHVTQEDLAALLLRKFIMLDQVVVKHNDFSVIVGREDVEDAHLAP